MPDKDTKKDQQENTTPAVSATEDIQQQRKEALDKAIDQVTFNPDSTNIGSMEKAAIARQNLTDDQKRSLGVEKAIHNAYSSPIQETSNRIAEWETARNTLKAQDETAQRRGRSMQMIAGISDGLASLANLIGVGQGGTNIDMGTGSLTPLAQKLEAARLERKADIKSIDDRLDQYRNQLLQMQLAKGTALAQAQEKGAERAYQTSERLATQAWTSGEKEKDRTADATIAGAKMANDSYQKALDRANAKDVATIRSGNKGGSGAKTGFVLTEEDGTQAYYEMDKARAEAIITKMGEAMTSDLANENVSMELKSAWDAYKNLLVQERVGVGADEELEDARNKVINLSPYMRKLITGESFKKTPKVDEDEFSGNRVG